MRSFQSVDFTLDDRYIRVTGTYTAEVKAQIYGPPDRCYPGEPAEFAIETALAELEKADGSVEYVDLMRLPQEWLEGDFFDRLESAAVDAIDAAGRAAVEADRASEREYA